MSRCRHYRSLLMDLARVSFIYPLARYASPPPSVLITCLASSLSSLYHPAPTINQPLTGPSSSLLFRASLPFLAPLVVSGQSLCAKMDSDPGQPQRLNSSQHEPNQQQRRHNHLVELPATHNSISDSTLSSPFTRRRLEAVTPGIDLSTYFPSTSPSDLARPSYFSAADPNIPPGPANSSNLVERQVPAMAAALARRESLSDIRAANPDLSLSGNIISATFTTPMHSITAKEATGT
uniref:Uncharacterized protein n=1 Tax=Bionectria ochroleuca TaxID=29856 RepID=A0A8H7KCX8_BIOOC